MSFIDYFLCWLDSLIPQFSFAGGGLEPARLTATFRLPTCFAKGGGGGGSKKIYLAQTPTVISAASAPATETKADTATAATDTLKKEASKKGIASTLLAGETGGYDNTGKKTLLG